MDTDRIAALLDPFLGPPATPRLTPAVLQHISTYIDILVRWNARINLTAIRDPEDIVPRHFGESLFAASHLFPKPSPESSVSSVVKPPSSVSPMASVVEALSVAKAVADVGSGAGFPGIPLKLWAPDIALTLIESNHKKATFLREIARSLTLPDVNVVNTRAETLAEAFDLVTLRAVEDFRSVLRTAAALVVPGGRLALLIGSSQIELAHVVLPHFSWATPIPVPLSKFRVLIVAHSGATSRTI